MFGDEDVLQRGPCGASHGTRHRTIGWNSGGTGLKKAAIEFSSAVPHLRKSALWELGGGFSE